MSHVTHHTADPSHDPRPVRRACHPVRRGPVAGPFYWPPILGPSKRPVQAAILWVSAAMLAAWCAPVQAQDVVYYGDDLSRSTKLQGSVVDYNGKELVLAIPGGAERKFASGGVLKIETKRTPQHEEGDRLFAQRKWDEALRAYMSADTHETRAWVRRELWVQIIWCHRYLDQDHLAGEYFMALLASDPATPFFDCIPLVWITREVSPTLETKAQQWLQHSQSAVQLIAASHLLGTPHRAQAIERLRDLRFDGDTRIAALARAQLWRTQAAITPNTLAEWEKSLADIPENLRAGPYFVLATGFSRQLQPEAAALSYLKVPVLFPRERRLAARALLEAAQESTRLGRSEDARLLQRELMQQYPDSPEASEAARSQRR